MEEVKKKVLEGVELNSDEVRLIIGEEIFPIIDEDVGDSQRWVTYISKIFEIDGRLFSVNYASGNTEMQENEYYPQIAHEMKKVIVITHDYVRKV